MFTVEDMLDDLDEDLGVARRRVMSLERAPFEGRVADEARWERSLRAARRRVWELEKERAGLIAERIADAERLRP